MKTNNKNKQYPKAVNEYKRIEQRNKFIEELDKQLEYRVNRVDSFRHIKQYESEDGNIVHGIVIFQDYTEEENKRSKEFYKRIKQIAEGIEFNNFVEKLNNTTNKS